ncbi:unnamed protein product [Parajaminaea phylloscopi]
MVLSGLDPSLGNPSGGRLKLATQGAPHLSTIESIGTPSDYSNGSSNAVTPLDIHVKGDLRKQGEDDLSRSPGSYFRGGHAGSLPGTAKLAHIDLPSPERFPVPLLRHQGSQNTLRSDQSGSPRTRRASTVKSLADEEIAAPSSRRVSVATAGGSSARSAWGGVLMHRLGGRDRGQNMPSLLTHDAVRRLDDGYTGSDGSDSASSSDSGLWGTPVDAEAVAMGLVAPDSVTTSSARHKNRHESQKQVRKTASLSSLRSQSRRRPPKKLPRGRPGDKHGDAARGPDSPYSDAPSHGPNGNGDILAHAGISLDSSADPMREVRERCLSDLRSLLAKSIQHGCDSCHKPSAVGLWLWIWTSELLCTACAASAADQVGHGLKMTLVDRARALGGSHGITSGYLKEVDTQMLARIANSLPVAALRRLDAVNVRRSGTKGKTQTAKQHVPDVPPSPTLALGLALDRPLPARNGSRDSASFMRVHSPTRVPPVSSAPWRKNGHSTKAPTVLRKALGKLAKRSFPRLHALAHGPNGTALAADLLLPDIPADAIARLPLPASPKRVPVERPAPVPADESFMSPVSSPSSDSSDSAASLLEVSKPTTESIFISSSTVFLGKLSVRPRSDGGYEALLDDVLSCSVCEGTFDDSTLLSSTKAEHQRIRHRDIIDAGDMDRLLVPFHLNWQTYRGPAIAAKASPYSENAASTSTGSLPVRPSHVTSPTAAPNLRPKRVLRHPSSAGSTDDITLPTNRGSPFKPASQARASDPLLAASSHHHRARSLSELGRLEGAASSPLADQKHNDEHAADGQDDLVEQALTDILLAQPSHSYLQSPERKRFSVSASPNNAEVLDEESPVTAPTRGSSAFALRSAGGGDSNHSTMDDMVNSIFDCYDEEQSPEGFIDGGTAPSWRDTHIFPGGGGGGDAESYTGVADDDVNAGPVQERDRDGDGDGDGNGNGNNGDGDDVAEGGP